MNSPVESLATTPHHLRRVVTDGSNRVEWMRARARGITATDVAKLSTPRS
ncbi:MAG: recombinase, partial [Microbacteriaceae bacterium]|nr:recombinase [Microbacteriaceae bacterium]